MKKIVVFLLMAAMFASLGTAAFADVYVDGYFKTPAGYEQPNTESTVACLLHRDADKQDFVFAYFDSVADAFSNLAFTEKHDEIWLYKSSDEDLEFPLEVEGQDFYLVIEKASEVSYTGEVTAKEGFEVKKDEAVGKEIQLDDAVYDVTHYIVVKSADKTAGLGGNGAGWNGNGGNGGNGGGNGGNGGNNGGNGDNGGNGGNGDNGGNGGNGDNGNNGGNGDNGGNGGSGTPNPGIHVEVDKSSFFRPDRKIVVDVKIPGVIAQYLPGGAADVDVDTARTDVDVAVANGQPTGEGSGFSVDTGSTVVEGSVTPGTPAQADQGGQSGQSGQGGQSDSGSGFHIETGNSTADEVLGYIEAIWNMLNN